MSLSADPTYTRAGIGNVLANTLLTAGSNTTATFSVGDSAGTPSSAVSGTLQVYDIAGTAVAATNGLSISVFKTADTAPNYSTVAYVTGPTLVTVASSTTSCCLDLPPGQYQLLVTNLDATNNIHAEATLALVQ